MCVIPIPARAGITGFESPAAEYTQLGLSLEPRGAIGRSPKLNFYGLCLGDSMQDVGIFDGDILIVDRHETARNGDVIVANLNREFVCIREQGMAGRGATVGQPIRFAVRGAWRCSDDAFLNQGSFIVIAAANIVLMVTVTGLKSTNWCKEGAVRPAAGTMLMRTAFSTHGW